MSFASDVGLDLPVIAIDKTYRCVLRPTLYHVRPRCSIAAGRYCMVLLPSTARIAAPHCAFQ